jgi:ribulose-bisphosphate carboxylase large chain
VTGRFQAVYLLETPLAPERAADVLAGEQSCGTFVKVRGETAELHAKARATVDAIEELEPLPAPSLPNAWLERQGARGPWRRARVTVSFPIDNVGANLATLAATVAGNLYDLGEATGVRLLSLTLPADYRARFQRPAQGVAGTRRLTGVADRPLLGTIVKPNVGLSAEATGALVGELCDAGIDFVKDDEVCANPVHAPIVDRVHEVMAHVRRYQDRRGRLVMVAFNITDDLDAMRRHAELVEREGGSAVMVSLNWCGLSAVQSLRRSTGLAIHGHRNGFGMMARHPALGMSFDAYQALWRLTGIDHLHVHGLDGKFADSNEEVAAAARACLGPVAAGGDPADAVLPAFSSGQWAGTLPQTFAAAGGSDFIFLSGGGILAHPDGPGAGVASLRQACEAVRTGVSLEAFAGRARELARALEFYGRKTG